MKISDLPSVRGTHVLVFGDPKTGKSTLVSKLAEDGYNLIWLSMDNGQDILKKLSPAAQERVTLVMLPDTRDYPVAVDSCRQLMEMKPCNICDRHGKNNCSVCKAANGSFTAVDFSKLGQSDIVVFDNISQFSDSYVSLICKNKPVDYKLQLDDWGALSFHLKKGLTDMQQAPYSLVAIAHAVEEPITDNSKKIMPMVGSSTFSPKVAGYFDHVVYCSLVNKTHRFGSATTYSMNVITGSRTDVKIEDMKDGPSLKPFFAAPIVSTTSDVGDRKNPVTSELKTSLDKLVATPNSETASTLQPASTGAVPDKQVSSLSTSERARAALLAARNKK